MARSGRVETEARLAAEDREQVDPVPDERCAAENGQRRQAEVSASVGHRGRRRSKVNPMSIKINELVNFQRVCESLVQSCL